MKSDITEDIEQIRAQVNSIVLKNKKEEKEYVGSEQVHEILSSKIGMYLSEFSKIRDVNNLRQDLSEFESKVEYKTAETSDEIKNLQAKWNDAVSSFDSEGIKTQLYDQLSQSISQEWDLKFKSFNSEFEQTVQKKVTNYQSAVDSKLEQFKDLAMANQSEIDDINQTLPKVSSSIEEIRNLQTSDIFSMKNMVNSLNQKLMELQNASNLIDTKHETGSKFYSNEKQESKEKDIEVADVESYKKFEMSPVKVSHLLIYLIIL